MTKEFMQAVTQSGLKTHEFVFIMPWLQAEAKVRGQFYANKLLLIKIKDASPWVGADGQMVQNVKEFFTGSIIVCCVIYCFWHYVNYFLIID
jgi:hypothetical protein